MCEMGPIFPQQNEEILFEGPKMFFRELVICSNKSTEMS